MKSATKKKSEQPIIQTEFDREKYIFIEVTFPFKEEIYNLYWGDVAESVSKFESRHGKAEKIYYDSSCNLIGIVNNKIIDMMNARTYENRITRVSEG